MTKMNASASAKTSQARIFLRFLSINDLPIPFPIGSLFSPWQRSKPNSTTSSPSGPVSSSAKMSPSEKQRGDRSPDAAEIPTITGRIVTISRQVEHDEDVPLRQYDKILFHPKNAIPVDFEPTNQLFVVPVEDIVAVFRKKRPDSEE